MIFMEIKKPFLSRDDTKVMKGIAVFFMLMHHLWNFPERTIGGPLKCVIHLFGLPATRYFGSFGMICISMFLFLGGYGIYIEFNHKPYDIVKKIKSLYLAYWRVFVIFVPISFLFFTSQPVYCEEEIVYARFASFSENELVRNFFGLSSSFNGEWWFLKSYVIAVCSFPLIRAIVERFSARINIFLVIVGGLLVGYVLPNLDDIEILAGLRWSYLYSQILCQIFPYVMCFWMGVVCAKDALLYRLAASLKSNRFISLPVDVMLLFLVTYLREIEIGAELDFLYVPVLIVAAADLLSRAKIIRTVFLRLGKESTNMWLTHSYFCYYFYPMAKLIAAPRWAVPSLLLLIALSYAAAVCLTAFWGWIERTVSKRAPACMRG